MKIKIMIKYQINKYNDNKKKKINNLHIKD